MEELIKQLENKQSEYTDLEDYANESGLTDEEYNCLVNGWNNAFEIAITIIRENENLFKKGV